MTIQIQHVQVKTPPVIAANMMILTPKSSQSPLNLTIINVVTGPVTSIPPGTPPYGIVTKGSSAVIYLNSNDFNKLLNEFKSILKNSVDITYEDTTNVVCDFEGFKNQENVSAFTVEVVEELRLGNEQLRDLHATVKQVLHVLQRRDGLTSGPPSALSDAPPAPGFDGLLGAFDEDSTFESGKEASR
jgi:hypothetical protein